MDSKIILCQEIKLDKSYSNVLDYTTNQMLELVESKAVYSQSNLSYLDYIGQTIKLNCDYATAIGCNYLAFQNIRHGNKWYFAFIDDVKYEAPSQCTVSFTIDIWSTFFNDWNQKPCFVEREHVNNDTIGLHTIDEGIPVNRFISTDSTSAVGNESGWIIVECNWDPATYQDFSLISIVNNNVYGNALYIFRNDETSQSNGPGWEQLALFLISCTNNVKIDAINNIYQVPYNCILPSQMTAQNFTVDVGGTQMTGTFYKYTSATTGVNKNSKKITDSPNNTVKNNKCNIYPYRYLYVTNNSGNANTYKWEQFTHDNGQVVFEIEYAIGQGGSVRATPKNYQGFEKKYDESIPLGKYPNCGWTSDSYILWKTQNAVNNITNFVSNVFGASQQVNSSIDNSTQAKAKGQSYNSTGDALNIIGNSVSAVGNLVANDYQAQLLPNTLSGSNVGDVAFASKSLRFDFFSMQLCDEELNIIDDYFTRYGYKINETKLANITGRPYWNYIKIAQGESIGYGTVPSKYMDVINNICMNGVTIWHSHSNIGNYNLDNSL